jgi:hypothetical protein
MGAIAINPAVIRSAVVHFRQSRARSRVTRQFWQKSVQWLNAWRIDISLLLIFSSKCERAIEHIIVMYSRSSGLLET